jgi:hypothetical protein
VRKTRKGEWFWIVALEDVVNRKSSKARIHPDLLSELKNIHGHLERHARECDEESKRVDRKLNALGKLLLK